MKSKLFVIMFILSFTCLFAQLDINLGPDWNLTGVGARAEGMGGAFIGVADDATALSWNPAGLSQLEKSEASIVGRGLAEIYEAEFDYGSEIYEDEHGILNFVSGVYPLELSGKQFVAALAIQRQLDLYSYYHEEYYEDGSEYYNYFYETYSEGGASTISIGLAHRVASIFSTGFAANLWVGEAYRESNDETDEGDGTNTYYYEYNDNSSWTFSGFNFVAGAMLDFNYLANPIPLKIGLSAKSPFSLEVEETYNEEEYTDDNGTITEYYPEEETSSLSLEMPLMLGIGASYRFGDNFTFAVDVESRKFGDTSLKEDYEELTGNEEEMENQDLNQLRFGGEYLLTELWDYAVIPLRVGAQTNPTLFKDKDEEQVVGGAISFGSGIITDRYSFDISLKGSVFEINREDTDGDEFVFNKTMNTITLSFIYYF